MEKQIEEKYVEISEGLLIVSLSVVLVGFSSLVDWNGLSDRFFVGYESVFDNQRISLKDEEVEKVEEVFEDSIRKELRRNDLKNLWVMSMVSRIVERYECLVCVNKFYFFLNKFFNKVMFVFIQLFMFVECYIGLIFISVEQ